MATKIGKVTLWFALVLIAIVIIFLSRTAR
jgi:hypothetical protein